jgi:flagellar basal-body rod modification protein FlgD
MAVEVNATSATSSYGSGYTASSTASEELGMDQFLSLLIAQIRNQDPLSPMDNQQFISQLTQFTQLEQLQGMNSRLEDSMTLTQSLNNTMMLGLVGRPVTVAGDGVTVSGGEVSRSQVSVAVGGTATVEVRDSTGRLVRTYQEPVEAGLADVTWDGQDDDGEQVEDGSYELTVTVVDRQGNEVENTLFMTGTVESLKFVNNLAVVEVGGQDYYVSEILAVNR